MSSACRWGRGMATTPAISPAWTSSCRILRMPRKLGASRVTFRLPSWLAILMPTGWVIQGSGISSVNPKPEAAPSRLPFPRDPCWPAGVRPHRRQRSADWLQIFRCCSHPCRPAWARMIPTRSYDASGHPFRGHCWGPFSVASCNSRSWRSQHPPRQLRRAPGRIRPSLGRIPSPLLASPLKIFV